MEIKTFKKLKDNKYKIILDTDEEINLYDDVIVKYNLLVNKKLDKNKLAEISKYNSRMDAYYLSIKALNKKMRTKKELYTILKKKDIESSIISEVIDKLDQENYLNENRYIIAYISDQINLNIIGPNKIRTNLIELGLNIDEINAYLDTIDEMVWINKINKYITKKIKRSSNLSANKLRQKIVIDLVTKGYPKEMVMNIIDDYKFETDKDLVIKEYNKLKKKLEVKFSGNELKYHIKYKLLSKGFTSEEVETALKGE